MLYVTTPWSPGSLTEGSDASIARPGNQAGATRYSAVSAITKTVEFLERSLASMLMRDWLLTFSSQVLTYDNSILIFYSDIFSIKVYVLVLCHSCKYLKMNENVKKCA